MISFNCSKETALINLWKGTNTIGMGFIHSHQQPTENDAKQTLENSYIDYFYGRPIKTDFSTFPNLRPIGYDIYAGDGTMQKVANSTAINHKPTKELSLEEIDQLEKKCQLNIVN